MELNRVTAEQIANEHYEVVIIGSGFGSTFFLNEAVERLAGRALVIEWGDYYPWAQQILNNQNSEFPQESTYLNRGDKPWNMTIGFGGGMNCWYALTPRFHPYDFHMKSRYGVSNDWPLGYDALERYYCDAERIMSISGDPDMATLLPRTMPFPLPPHKGTSADVLMKAAMPQHHFIVPTGRASAAN
ncbi:hypothetical protein [Halopseudomonas nanhaiensis]|uniref:hypothetical protein n=1 Tax=Halopseudomonas nanhaiensis TaxID=2830842 RepID=UPI001CBB2A6E|nr:hypothetical protein [Halopseudomonas nanhaiensis]